MAAQLEADPLEQTIKEQTLPLLETAAAAEADPLVDSTAVTTRQLRSSKKVLANTIPTTKPKAAACRKQQKRFRIDPKYNVLRLEKRCYLKNSTRTEEQRSYQAEWACKKRRCETVEEREKRCLKQRIAAIKRRLLEQLTMTEDEIQQRNAEMANKKRQKRMQQRAEQTEELKRQRSEKLLYCCRRLKVLATPEEKLALRQKQRLYRNKRKMCETAEEAAERKERNRLYHSKYRKRQEKLVKQPRKRRTNKKEQSLKAMNLSRTMAGEEQQQQQNVSVIRCGAAVAAQMALTTTATQ